MKGWLMTRRESFAQAALTGILARPRSYPPMIAGIPETDFTTPEYQKAEAGWRAAEAVRMADALIAALDEEKNDAG